MVQHVSLMTNSQDHMLDTTGSQSLYLVEEYGLVCKLYQWLWFGQCKGSQSGPIPTNKDQGFHLSKLHLDLLDSD